MNEEDEQILFETIAGMNADIQLIKNTVDRIEELLLRRNKEEHQ